MLPWKKMEPVKVVNRRGGTARLGGVCAMPKSKFQPEPLFDEEYEVCPRCGGSGVVADVFDPSYMVWGVSETKVVCLTCNGKGTVS